MLRRSLGRFSGRRQVFFNLTDIRERGTSRTSTNTAIGWTTFFHILTEWARWSPCESQPSSAQIRDLRSIALALSLSTRRNSKTRLSHRGFPKDFPKILFPRVLPLEGKNLGELQSVRVLRRKLFKNSQLSFYIPRTNSRVCAFPFIPIQGNRALFLNVLFFYNFSTIAGLDKLPYAQSTF
jgi:hypothetical protein